MNGDDNGRAISQCPSRRKRIPHSATLLPLASIVSSTKMLSVRLRSPNMFDPILADEYRMAWFYRLSKVHKPDVLLGLVGALRGTPIFGRQNGFLHISDHSHKNRRRCSPLLNRFIANLKVDGQKQWNNDGKSFLKSISWWLAEDTVMKNNSLMVEDIAQLTQITNMLRIQWPNLWANPRNSDFRCDFRISVARTVNIWKWKTKDEKIEVSYVDDTSAIVERGCHLDSTHSIVLHRCVGEPHMFSDCLKSFAAVSLASPCQYSTLDRPDAKQRNSAV